jgi:hypothetical protein
VREHSANGLALRVEDPQRAHLSATERLLVELAPALGQECLQPLDVTGRQARSPIEVELKARVADSGTSLDLREGWIVASPPDRRSPSSKPICRTRYLPSAAPADIGPTSTS